MWQKGVLLLMFRVLSGDYMVGTKVPRWVRDKVDVLFDRRVDESWLDDDIISRELLEVENIVKIDGLMLTKKSGRRIPVHWISQGSKQFIVMTRYPNQVVDCLHVGWNVYKFFWEWANTKNIDVTMLMNGNGALYVKDLSGIYLNSGDTFSTSRELVDLIYRHDCDHLHGCEGNDGYIVCDYSKESAKVMGRDSRIIRLF